MRQTTPAPEGRQTLRRQHHPDQSAQRRRLAQLTPALQVFDARERELPSGITLPEKDAPILLAAMETQATHLVTGDVRHSGVISEGLCKACWLSLQRNI